MEICDMLPTISKSLAMLGLSMDIFGVFKLFDFDPKPIEELESIQFTPTGSVLNDFNSESDRIDKLNRNIETTRINNDLLRDSAIKWKNVILAGFIVQFISIILSLFYT